MKTEDNQGGFEVLNSLHGVTKKRIPPTKKNYRIQAKEEKAKALAEALEPKVNPKIETPEVDPTWLRITNNALFHRVY